MPHAHLNNPPPKPARSTSGSRESFIRETAPKRNVSTGSLEQRVFERLLINMLPSWDDAQPFPPRDHTRLTERFLLGLGLVGIGLGLTAFLRRR